MKGHLAEAVTYLDEGGDPARPGARGACWLARAAFEDAMRRILLGAQCDPGRSSMRTQLSCVEALFGASQPDLVRGADYAWTALSRASHQHAYELCPTLEECRHLIQLVERFELA